MLVMRNDNNYDYVDDIKVDSMIKSKEIVKFKRNTEWVNVEASPVRGNMRDRVYNGANSTRLAINDAIFVNADRNADK